MMFGRNVFWGGVAGKEIDRLRESLEGADMVLIGAGAGLSASAGFVYEGERFDRYFHDFGEKYDFRDMYLGGFFPFETLEEHWAYWSRYIWINRYQKAPRPVYEKLFDLVKEKNYFVLTTNVDHCFQKAGFDKQRLFYTQGDYGLWQCSRPCHKRTYDNEDKVRKMVEAQGFLVDGDCQLALPQGLCPAMSVPAELIPCCPKCGEPMVMNLRADDSFVENDGWHRAASRYRAFLGNCQNASVLYLELGVGMNTPGIIKYPFWKLTAANPKATYACINAGEAYGPQEIAGQTVCLDGDIGEILYLL